MLIWINKFILIKAYDKDCDSENRFLLNEIKNIVFRQEISFIYI